MAWRDYALFLGKNSHGERLENSFNQLFLPCAGVLFYVDGDLRRKVTELATLNPELYKNLFDNSGAESIIYQYQR